jgi:peroxiredoxin
VLEVGDRIPDVKVWLAPRESISLRDLVEEGSVLVLFYLFDWSESQ